MKSVELFLFMGQSNMAGRGDGVLAPEVAAYKASEYRAISSPNRLYSIQEPFGAAENNEKGVSEPEAKTGSLVSAFINAFYEDTKTESVCVSCAKGGSSISEWIAGTSFFSDASARYLDCAHYLENSGYHIENRYMLWCQGCTDADNGMEKEEYLEKTLSFFRDFFRLGISRVFLIQIGNHRENPTLYQYVQEAQQELTQIDSRIIMVSDLFKTFAQRGLMRDSFHYTQEGYNLVGTQGGRAAAAYINQYKKSLGL